MEGFRMIQLNAEEMRRLARYEDSFDKYTEGSGLEDLVFFNCPSPYIVTVEDLYAALLNMREKGPDMEDLFMNWFIQMDRLSSAFGMKFAFSRSRMDDEFRQFNGLPVTDEDMKAEILGAIFDAWAVSLPLEQVDDMGFLDECIESVELYLQQRDKPLEERSYTDVQKKRFVKACMDNSRINGMDSRLLEILRRSTEELILKDDTDAMRLKAFCCVGGNALYDNDLDSAYDLTSRLYEITDDPGYAYDMGKLITRRSEWNTEQGREKALRLLSLASLYRIPDAKMTLADMYGKGYGCKKSPKTEKLLYKEVYDDAFHALLEEQVFPRWFSMAALHLFDVYADGRSEIYDMRAAYYYLLQAKCAADSSYQEAEHFSMITVAEEIQNRVESITQEAYEAVCPAEGYRSGEPVMLREIIKQAGAVYLDLEDNGNGEADIVATTDDYVLITVPESSYCRFTDEIRIGTVGMRSSIEVNDDHKLRVDRITRDHETDQITLWNGGENVGWMWCLEFRIQ